MEIVEQEIIDLLKFVIIKPEIMKYITPSLNPEFHFGRDVKLWCIRSESMDEAFFVEDEMFKKLRFCEECYFTLKEEKDSDFFYRHVESHVDIERLDANEASSNFP